MKKSKKIPIWPIYLFPLLILAAATVCQFTKMSWVPELLMVAAPVIIYVFPARLLYRRVKVNDQRYVIGSLDQRVAFSAIPAFVSFLSVVIAVILFLFFAGLIAYAKIRKSRIDKKAKKLQEESFKEDVEWRNQRKAEKTKAERRLEELKNENSVSWKDLWEINKYDIPIPASVIFKASFSDLLTVSNVKKHLTFVPHDIEFAAKEFEGIFQSMRDEDIQKVIEIIRSLEKYANYKGYAPLYDILNTVCPNLTQFSCLRFPKKTSVQ